MTGSLAVPTLQDNDKDNVSSLSMCASHCFDTGDRTRDGSNASALEACPRPLDYSASFCFKDFVH